MGGHEARRGQHRKEAIKMNNEMTESLAEIELGTRGFLESLNELENLRKELQDMNASFELRWKADMRAITRWQIATGRLLVWPDHADLCVWLMEQNDQLRAENERLTK